MQEKCELDKIKDQRKVVRIALMPKADPLAMQDKINNFCYTRIRSKD